jgi:cysteine desulfuration protein SufE
VRDAGGVTRWRHWTPEGTWPRRHADPVAVQDEIIASFRLFPEWLDRYQYLIDLGKTLPPLAEEEKIDDKLLAGCVTGWRVPQVTPHGSLIRANSDAAIVSGLIALLIQVYSGCSARQIIGTEPHFVQGDRSGRPPLPTRANGLHAMLNAIKSHAQSLL